MSELIPITRKEKILNGETLTPQNREEYFLQKAIGEGGGSGGGGNLPSYSFADTGKVLTLAQGTDDVVVVPEQTVTTDSQVTVGAIQLNYAAELSGVSITLENGPNTLNGTIKTDEMDEETDIVLEKGNVGYEFDSLPVLYYDSDSGKWYVAEVEETTITISATAPSVHPSWEIGLPDYSGANEGAVLTIVDGSPMWVGGVM